MNIMKELNKKKGTTIINITHNIDEVAFFDNMIVLKDGKILKKGTPREVLSNDLLLKEAGLCLAQIPMLVSSLNKEGLVEEKVALDVDECVFILARLLKGERTFSND